MYSKIEEWQQPVAKLAANAEPCMTSGHSPSPIVEGTTLESLIAEHDRATEVYRATNIYGKLSRTLRETVLAENSLRVSSCICLCLGSLSGLPEIEDEDPENTKIMSQLVAFEGIIELLKSKFDIGAVYFQDPVFNRLDIMFLTCKGYTVLTSPDALNFMTTETFLFTPYCPSSCLSACLKRAFPSMALGLTITKQVDWFYDSTSDPDDPHKQNRLPARYQSRELYESFLRTRQRIDIPLMKVPIPRRERAKSDSRIKSSAPGYVPAPRIPLYFVTDAWRGLPPVDSRFQVSKHHLLNKKQADAIMRSKDMLPLNATQDDTNFWNFLKMVDDGAPEIFKKYSSIMPSTIWETVPRVYKDFNPFLIYAENQDVGDTHLSDFDKGSSDEEGSSSQKSSPWSSAQPISSSSSAKSSSYWADNENADTESEMDLC